MAGPLVSHEASVPSAGSALAGSNCPLLREAVQEILASASFQRSPRLRQLLSYIAEHTISGDADSLKEPVIGQRVFSRPANYSAAEDNIVRSNIRQLRAKLEEYYAGPGAGSPYRLSIPKGAYSICLLPAQESAPPPSPSSAPRSRRRINIWLAVALPALLAGAFLLGRRSAQPVPQHAQPPCLLSLLDPNPGQRLLVVVPDSGGQLYQTLTGRPIHLEDYISRRFLSPEGLQGLPPVIADNSPRFFGRELTEGFVLHLIPRFAQVVPAAELSVRHPRTLAVKDFERDNALLISGPWGDPWVQLFDHALNFQIVVDTVNRRTRILNLHPRSGEQTEYDNFTDASKTVVCYARVAYLPGLSQGSRVLLAGGPHAASTQAASLFLTRHDALDTVVGLFHATSARSLPWFELLVEARAIGDAPWSMRILAWRAVASPNRQ